LKRHVTSRSFPKKAISFPEYACSRVMLWHDSGEIESKSSFDWLPRSAVLPTQLMRVFCENYAWTSRITRGHTRRENYQCLSDLECEIKQYKSKDIILIVWKIIGTLGIYLQNGMVFMNDFLSIYSTSIFIVCGNDGVTSSVFIPW
jgi:hypothetical protein